MIAVVGMIAAIIIPHVVTVQTEKRPWYAAEGKDGWTWVAQTQNGDHIYKKYLPEEHVTIYCTWRAMSVVKD